MSAISTRGEAGDHKDPATNGANDLAAENERLREKLESLADQLRQQKERAGHLEKLLEAAVPALIEKSEWHHFKDLVSELEERLVPTGNR
jgi:predicted  nucleic acid-binding Zn-ribbon protein